MRRIRLGTKGGALAALLVAAAGYVTNPRRKKEKSAEMNKN